MRKMEKRQDHGLVSDDSVQVVMPELVLPTLRPMCKTNPNDDRGQNLETSIFQWKMDILGWKCPNEKTCFYETNPNRELQDTWRQGFVKKPNVETNKTKPNKPK